MNKFCFECGTKLEYKFNPPNFCPSCGVSIKDGQSKKVEPARSEASTKISKSSKSSEDSEGYTDANYIPNISKLEYEIEDFGDSNQQTIGSLGGKISPMRKNNIIKKIDDL
tara:strand:- start:1255 stop:1587 length:333 start_codon:yes stop_codon:yes gene_type:complete